MAGGLRNVASGVLWELYAVLFKVTGYLSQMFRIWGLGESFRLKAKFAKVWANPRRCIAGISFRSLEPSAQPLQWRRGWRRGRSVTNMG